MMIETRVPGFHAQFLQRFRQWQRLFLEVPIFQPQLFFTAVGLDQAHFAGKCIQRVAKRRSHRFIFRRSSIRGGLECVPQVSGSH